MKCPSCTVTEPDVVAACLELISDTSPLTPGEQKLLGTAGKPPCKADLKKLNQAILQREDPLGELFSTVRTASQRRMTGAVYTPYQIVHSMLRWLEQQTPSPTRIVDPGAGSGRFVLEAARLFPKADLVAVEMDPLAALILRANLHVLGHSKRAQIVVDDYRNIKLDRISGVTAYIGNPPYVRHHDIDAVWKKWYAAEFLKLGICASALAGLHLHFFLKTRLLASKNDVGALITSAEWMDVNYGSALRRLLVDGLGGVALHVLEPSVEVFPGTATTAAITCFKVGEGEGRPIRTRSVKSLGQLKGLTAGKDIPRSMFKTEPRWSIIVRPSGSRVSGNIELGELFRVHRGQVTGSNQVWIAGEQAKHLPDSVLIPSVTKARDLLSAGERLGSTDFLRRVVDIPTDLDGFTKAERKAIEKFLKWAALNGADQSYIAQHRKAWWSVGLRAPAAILCTYMARRPPQFTLNDCGARHINIAHGLYPAEHLDQATLGRVVAWLNGNVCTSSGRTYAGGLTKFEPKEIERLQIPRLETFAI